MRPLKHPLLRNPGYAPVYHMKSVAIPLILSKIIICSLVGLLDLHLYTEAFVECQVISYVMYHITDAYYAISLVKLFIVTTCMDLQNS